MIPKIAVNPRESLTLRDKTVIIPKLIEKKIGRRQNRPEYQIGIESTNREVKCNAGEEKYFNLRGTQEV